VGADILDEGPDKELRFAASRADEDVVAGMDLAEDDVFRSELVGILLRDLLEPGMHVGRA